MSAVSGTARAWWASAGSRERGRLLLAAALGALATLASPALLALSGYLLARASQAPPIFTLTAAIVGVRLFGLLRATTRYAERLVAHDLALRRLGRMRVEAFARLVDLVPNALGPRSSTAVLDGVVADVERLQDLPVRVLVPGAALASAAAACVGAAALMLPAAGLILALTLAVQALALALLAMRTAGRLARAQAAARARLAGEMVLVLDAAPELVAWGAAEAQARRVAEAGAEVDALTRRGAWLSSAGGAVTMVAGAWGRWRRSPRAALPQPRAHWTGRSWRPWRCSRSGRPSRSARSPTCSSRGARWPSRRRASRTCSAASARRRPGAWHPTVRPSRCAARACAAASACC